MRSMHAARRRHATFQTSSRSTHFKFLRQHLTFHTYCRLNMDRLDINRTHLLLQMTRMLLAW
jgi:hypothetical protein